MNTSQVLIWVAIGIGVFIVLIFRIGRFSGIKSDTRLYLNKKTGGEAPALSSHTMSPETAEAMAMSGGELGRTKSLNMMFIFNGKTYDAYEVLGLPAGANKKMIEQAYREHKTRQQGASTGGGAQAAQMELTEAAYRALA